MQVELKLYTADQFCGQWLRFLWLKKWSCKNIQIKIGPK